jgi:hypothetical protein
VTGNISLEFWTSLKDLVNADAFVPIPLSCSSLHGAGALLYTFIGRNIIVMCTELN